MPPPRRAVALPAPLRAVSLLLLLLLLLLLQSAPVLGARLRDLGGAWHDGGQGYSVSATADGAVWAAACLTGGCSTWTAATITVLDDAAGTCRIVFSNEGGRNHTGQLDAASASVVWSDGSRWDRAQPPPPLRYTVDVVIIPHSHQDAGWQRTFEGYYQVEVTPILNNVLAWLSADPLAKFNQVEASFLQRWWVDQNETTRALYRSFVASGRLELVGGGWTMHDEESTNAYSAASNMAHGLRWLTDTFGARGKPRFLWQIDPSGHSIYTPTLAAMLGYDALVIDRVPDPVRQAYRAAGSLQFVWQPVNTSGALPPPAILTTILDSFYCTVGLAGSTPAELAASFYADILRRAQNSYLPDASGRITILWP